MPPLGGSVPGRETNFLHNVLEKRTRGRIPFGA